MAARKRKDPALTVKFNKDVDTGPPGYENMDKETAKTIHEERIRRQVRSRMGVSPKGRKY